MSVKHTRKTYLDEKKQILDEFCIPVTEAIEEKLERLYPNHIAIENYMRDLILASYDS